MDYGLLSLLPPMLAIILAIATRRVVVPLALAVFCGAVILSSDAAAAREWAAGAVQIFAGDVWEAVMGYDRRRALAFSLLLGAMVGVLEAGGGMLALVAWLGRSIRSRRGGQTLISALGLSIFFDDYANTLLIGGTMRTTADRFKISRAKLAYLVDSTAAPVAGLAPISTWVVIEISYIDQGLIAAGLSEVSPFAMFIASMPYRFYALLALVMVFTIAYSDRDFGPMRRQKPGPDADSEPLADWVPTSDETGGTADRTLRQKPGLGWAAFLPVVACVIAVLTSLVVSGRHGIDEQTHGLVQTFGAVISSGDSYQALINGGLTGLLLALLLHRMIGGSPWGMLARGAVRGALHMLPAMLILWFAWALSGQTTGERLDTGGYLASRLSQQLAGWFLPTAVFVIAAIVAFSTGTSWGTMGILTPLSIGLAVTIGADASGAADPFGPIVLTTVGSVLAGAIFGDHCSPLSDTTVLSSRACGCDHVTHVRTQLPYALSVGVIAILVGTLPAALGMSPYLCLGIASAVIVALVYAIGKPVEFDEPTFDSGTDDPAAS